MTTNADLERLTRRLEKVAHTKSAAPAFGVKKKQGATKRTKDRTPTFRAGRIIFSGRNEIGCVIRDLSETGARVALEGDVGLPERVILVISQTAARRKSKIIWRIDRELGLSFADSAS